MTLWLGDIEEDSVVTLPFSTHEAAGGNVAPSSALEIADIRVYKWSSATQRSSTAGMTMTSPFDSLTGVHMVEIDTSDNTDAGFWAAGNLYHILLAPDETVDGQTLTGVHLASFGIVYGAAAKQNTNIALILSRIGTPSNLGSGATVAGNLVDLEAQTDDIGAAGAGLTAVPWNAAWDAEVQSEAADAITAAALATAANLATLAGYVDTEVAAILAAVDTEVAAIKTKTDYLPSATAGAAGGLFIAGANAATSITTALTANITGNLSGSVGSVTGAVGSVTGAVGSVTGNVGGSVASVAANGITATSIATDAINAAAIKADAVTKIQTGLATPTNITAGTITTVTNLTNLPAAAALEATAQAILEDTGTTLPATLATIAGYVDTEVAAILAAVDTEVAAIKTKTDYLPSATAGAAGGVFIAGANAATSITTALTANITGDLSGSVGSVTGAVGSVTGAVGSVTGAVGSVTGNVGGNVVGSVGSVSGDTKQTADVAALITTVGVAGAGLTALATQASVNTIDDFLDTEIAAILADTNELQTDLVNGGRLDLLIDAIKAKTDNLPSDPADQSAVEAAITSATSPLATGANLATLAGYVDTEVASILAAVDTEVAAILADTNELQTDWANGGRLDLILDARSSQTSVDDLPTNSELATALASADDAVLAAIAALPTDADVQTAAAAALTAYDPPTNTEMEARTLAAASYATASALDAVDNFVDTEVAAIKAVTDKLDTAVELDGAVYRFTTNALEQAPTGGSAPSAADIRAEIDANSTQLAAIVADTNELQTNQGNWLTADVSALATAANLATLAGYVDTEVAAILADTNELQTDLVNGGRLDLLIDAIKAKTDNLPSDPADESLLEAAITAAVSGLSTLTEANVRTAVGLASANLDTQLAALPTDSDVQTAATTALNAYDPPTKAELDAAVAPLATAAALDAVDNYVDTEVAAIKAVTDKLDTAVELDGAVYRYTANALELAPTGGSAPSAADIRAEIDANSTQLAAIVADTNELQTNQGDWATADTSGLATSAALATVDSNVDAIKAKTDNLPASPAAVGSAMTLTSAYDAAKTAATQTSVDDLPTNSELATALAGITASVDQQDIADALLLAPSGAAASGSAMDGLANILEDTGTTIPAAIAGIGGLAGSGAISFPVTINDEDSNPIDGVEVWVSTDSAGTNVVAGTLSTDALGLATFMLDAGAYYVWRQKSGYNFANPVTITVS